MLVVRVHVSGMISPHGRSVIRVKVVGLYSQTSQGHGIDVMTSPDLLPLTTTPMRNVNGMPLSILLSLLLLNSHQNSLPLQRSGVESEEEVPCPISLYK